MNIKVRDHFVILLLGTLLLVTVKGAPKHREKHHNKPEEITNEHATSKSYIDIDASDPFKVPKGSHYIDQTVPNFSAEPDARATVENGEQSPSNEEDQRNDDEQTDDGDGGGGEESSQATASKIAEDIPDSVKDKISELAVDSKDGKPIEINEKDLKNMLNKDNDQE